MIHIGALVITFNPVEKILSENLYSIVQQVDKVLIVDNNSVNVDVINKLASQYVNVNIIHNPENYGIAKALNQGMNYLYLAGYSWVITLDQDSILPQGSIDIMKDFCDTKVGIVCPRIKYVGWTNYGNSNCDAIEEIDSCMTSASLTNIAAWVEIGGFADEYFIDYVDDDFCMKLRINKYKIIRVNNCVLEHRLGECGEYNVLGWKFRYCRHSSTRCYYIIRNIIVFNKTYKKYINPYKEFLKVVYFFVMNLFFSPPKLKTLRLMMKGIHDAECGLMGKLVVE